MNNNISNSSPYSPPASNLQRVNEENSITNFKRFSAWGVFFLAIFTFGIYSTYWIYTRAVALNTFHENKIPNNLIYSVPIIYIVTIVLQIAVEMTPGNTTMELAMSITNLAFMVVFLVTTFKLRNRIATITNDMPGPILTFFFNVIYLQYRINKAIDEVGSEQAS